MRSFFTILFAGAVTSQLGATDCGNVLRDPGFDLWCGDSLCAWKVEKGGVQRVPTWNEGDPGVELVGADVAIEQLTPVDSGDAQCLEFSLIANIDLDASVFLNIDVFGDGSVEHSERLPTARWQQLSYKLPIAGMYSGIRFELAKQGTGRAVLAQIAAKTTTECAGLVPIQPAPAPLGAPCTSAAGCASGICSITSFFGGACVACDAANPCPSGQACGLGDPTSPVRGLPHQCVPDASRQLGEPCIVDGECATGICTFAASAWPGGDHGTCSTCEPTRAACANGETCGPAWAPPAPATYPLGPWVCSPNAHRRAAGEACASDDDCASSACSGTVRAQCDDGRSCATAATCPFGGADTSSALQNGPCTTVGVQGGSCQ